MDWRDLLKRKAFWISYDDPALADVEDPLEKAPRELDEDEIEELGERLKDGELVSRSRRETLCKSPLLLQRQRPLPVPLDPRRESDGTWQQ